MLDGLLNNLLVFTILTIIFIVSCFVISIFIYKNVMSFIKNKDDNRESEYNTIVPQDDIVELIKRNYGETSIINNDLLIERGKQLEAKLLFVLRELYKKLNSTENSIVDKKEDIRRIINDTGKLNIDINKELKILFSFFTLMFQTNKITKDKLKEILTIQQSCKDLQVKINNICLVLLTQ